MFLMELGEKLKKIRKEQKWSQKDLARHSGIDFRLISRYESGDTMPSVEALKKLARTFRISTDYLLFDEIELEKYITDPVLLKYFETINGLDRLTKSIALEILEGLVLKAVTQGKVSQEDYNNLRKAG